MELNFDELSKQKLFELSNIDLRLQVVHTYKMAHLVTSKQKYTCKNEIINKHNHRHKSTHNSEQTGDEVIEWDITRVDVQRDRVEVKGEDGFRHLFITHNNTTSKISTTKAKTYLSTVY